MVLVQTSGLRPFQLGTQARAGVRDPELVRARGGERIQAVLAAVSTRRAATRELRGERQLKRQAAKAHRAELKDGAATTGLRTRGALPGSAPASEAARFGSSLRQHEQCAVGVAWLCRSADFWATDPSVGPAVGLR